MKNVLSVAFVFMVVAGFAQTSENSSSGKIRVGWTFSPDYCYRTLVANADTAQFIVDVRNEAEAPSFGFTTGLGLVFQIHERLALETGMKLSNKSDRIKSVVFTDINGNAIGEGKSKNSRYYFDIPVKVNYTLSAKRCNVFLSAGISPGFYLSTGMVSRIDYNGSSTGVTKTRGKEDNISEVDVAAIGGLGIAYSLSENLNLRIEPVFRYSLLPLNDEGPISQYNYSFGGNMGLFYEL